MYTLTGTTPYTVRTDDITTVTYQPGEAVPAAHYALVPEGDRKRFVQAQRAESAPAKSEAPAKEAAPAKALPKGGQASKDSKK